MAFLLLHNYTDFIDDLIVKQSIKIKVLKERKKGFLQKMFI